MTRLCAFLLLLLTSPCRSRTTPIDLAQECEGMEDVTGDVIRMVANVVPREFYQLVVENSFGDQVDWAALEGYSIPEAEWKEVLAYLCT